MTAAGRAPAPRESDRLANLAEVAAAKVDRPAVTAVVSGLLAIAAAVREHEDQDDAAAAMLAERINGVEDAIDTLTSLIDPPRELRPRRWRRLAQRLQYRRVSP
jgi:hypothetical protein